MGFLLVLLIAVIAVLLWRILAVQRARAQVEMAGLAVQLTRDLTTKLEAEIPPAVAAKRLIEWVDEFGRHIGATDAALREFLRSPDTTELRQLIVAESLARGVRCRHLDEKAYYSVAGGYPGPEPVAEPWCPSYCAEERDVSLPAGFDRCPFCGGETEPLELEPDETATWQAQIARWRAYAKLFPAEAATEQKEVDARWAQRRAAFEAALAAHRATGAR